MSLNPHQRKKVDISSMTEEEQKLFRLYGRLPQHKTLLHNQLKERKFFDSGDYALSKAGKSPAQSVGTAIPSPDTIPHKSPDAIATSGVPGAPGINSPISPIGSNGTGILGSSPTSTTSTVPSSLGPGPGGLKEPVTIAEEINPAEDGGEAAMETNAVEDGGEAAMETNPFEDGAAAALETNPVENGVEAAAEVAPDLDPAPAAAPEDEAMDTA